ncbi:YxeA family protein [Enterococcus hailinensis]|uniref:YxeA family protein n=1 Tax=Enterococcus hailinensis TaxID=3238988 RepID=UPI0038B2A3F4
MKKFLIGLVSLIVLAFVGLQIAQKVVSSGDDYYVQITNDGERIVNKDDSGNQYVDYKYSLPGYDKNGEEKQLTFSAAKDRPLRKDAFLKVTWNKKKGVTSYEEVQKKKVPEKAAEKLGISSKN